MIQSLRDFIVLKFHFCKMQTPQSQHNCILYFRRNALIGRKYWSSHRRESSREQMICNSAHLLCEWGNGYNNLDCKHYWAMNHVSGSCGLIDKASAVQVPPRLLHVKLPFIYFIILFIFLHSFYTNSSILKFNLKSQYKVKLKSCNYLFNLSFLNIVGKTDDNRINYTLQMVNFYSF